MDRRSGNCPTGRNRNTVAMKLTLPVFFSNNSIQARIDMGESPHYSEYDVRRCVFYHITALTVIEDNDGTLYCNIIAGETDLISPLKIREVEDLVDLATAIGFADGFKIWKEKTQNA